MPGTSLADWLRDQDDSMLAALLRARPDLATPAPPDTTVLATRAGIGISVARACEELDTFSLAVLEALLVADADQQPVPEKSILELFGGGVSADRVREGLAVLRARALAWGADPTLSVVPTAREVIGPFPAGLGRSAPHLDRQDLPAVVAGLSEAERRLLEALAAGAPVGQTKDAGTMVPPDRARTPVQRLLAAGLLLRRDAETVELPRQLGLLLRGEHPLGPVRLDEPELDTVRRSAADSDAAAAGEALELCRHVETLLRLWSTEPPPVLRSGGLGVRELRRAARALECTEPRATLIIELVVAAGLVAASDDTEPHWLLTVAADTWTASHSEQRWATLALAWLDMPRLPALAGSRDDRERLLSVLAEELRRPRAPLARRRALDELGTLPANTALRSDDSLVELLAWRAPRQGGRLRDEQVRWALSEAAAVGVSALGRLSSAGRALLSDGQAEAARLMGAAMPPPLDHILVQADLTVIAPGPLESDLASDMALVADVESAGSATVYRVGEASVRRALDAGRSATELHDLFAERSRTPIPQSLTYLIDDVARRHGRLRGGSAGSFLRCEDPVLLTEVLGRPEAAQFELRRLAPTVLVSPLPLAELLDGLRGAGLAPVAEGLDGRLLDLRPAGRRLSRRAGTGRRVVSPGPIDEERLAEVVTGIRIGDRTSGVRRGASASTASEGHRISPTFTLLQDAVSSRHQLWIGFVDSHGVATQRIIDPVSISGGFLEGFDQSVGAVQRYPLHRISTAALVEGSADAAGAAD
ncbi:helicase-associated domain-containing protein [Actinoalloteichus fjordicus]|uniref:Helicase conserved C-terminal domain n=1 Tax=Actinoalloteichus fjordicus TaxID=1612552 RepID=A0AAC9PUH9_9PSEU|nr:helicase-associated domain-containing protein [Actinoalloteichus fjordicus]APU17689.1 Helicase conserved C-terminal domain [Actinoalloteichus fjordicus]